MLRTIRTGHHHIFPTIYNIPIAVSQGPYHSIGYDSLPVLVGESNGHYESTLLYGYISHTTVSTRYTHTGYPPPEATSTGGTPTTTALAG